MVIGNDTPRGDRRPRFGSRVRLSLDSLKTEEFDGLLARLDADRNHAAVKYELLRRKLLKIFAFRKCPATEDMADETLDRVAKKLKTNEVPDIGAFAHGVALKLYLEISRDTARFASIHDTHSGGDWLPGEPDPENRIVEGMAKAKTLECLQKCLERLSSEDQHLILAYYQGEKQARIQERQNLADWRGISIEALRSVASGLRQKLRDCVTRRLSRTIRRT